MEEDEALPDNLRCNRTDGRQWRCKRRVKENMKLCEIHYLQGRHRQNKEVVPESLKLQRKKKTKNAVSRDQSHRRVKVRATKEEILAKLMMKRKRSSGEALRKVKKLRRGSNMEMELIRMVLKREVEKNTVKSLKKTKKKTVVVEEKEEEEEDDDGDDGDEDDDSEEELTRDLPNGLMAISASSSPSSNVGSDSPGRVKVGVDVRTAPQRRFRSKNIEAMPIGKLQVTYALAFLIILSFFFSFFFLCVCVCSIVVVMIWFMNCRFCLVREVWRRRRSAIGVREVVHEF